LAQLLAKSLTQQPELWLNSFIGNLQNIIVVSTIPIVTVAQNVLLQVSPTAHYDPREHWAYHRLDEQFTLLKALLDWKNPSQDGANLMREVTLMGGDAHIGGHTDIFFALEDNIPGFKQFITSQINSDPVTEEVFKTLLGALSLPFYQENGFSFKHHDFTRKSNYGLVKVEVKDNVPIVKYQLVVADNGETPQELAEFNNLEWQSPPLPPPPSQ
jgi:hypothetical protein